MVTMLKRSVSIPTGLDEAFVDIHAPIRPTVCQRPYHVERTRSRQLPEVKLRRVPLVLGWVTAWEYGMLLARIFFLLDNFFFILKFLCCSSLL